MSKNGKKIMAKKEREFLQSQTVSPQPQPIQTPDYPKDVIGTVKDESGVSIPCNDSQPDHTSSLEITLKGVPIVYEPSLGDNEATFVRPWRESDAGNPLVEKVDLDKFIGGLPMLAGVKRREPPFRNSFDKITVPLKDQDKLIDALRKARDMTIFIPPQPCPEEEADVCDCCGEEDLHKD
jgi:hypothetical protein